MSEVRTYVLEYNKPVNSFSGWTVDEFVFPATSDAIAIEEVRAFVRLTWLHSRHAVARTLICKQEGKQIALPVVLTTRFD